MYKVVVAGYHDVLHDLATEFIYKVPWIFIGQEINVHELLPDHLMPRSMAAKQEIYVLNFSLPGSSLVHA
jgi:hypothetical protein